MHLAPLQEHFGTTVPDELAALYGILADGGSELTTNEIAELLPPESTESGLESRSFPNATYRPTASS